jgi:hypothetical protein
MDVDLVIGTILFLVFVGWAFSYYFAMFQQSEGQFELAAAVETERIMNFMAVDVYEAPVRYEAGSAVADAVLKAKSVWYHGEPNATRVFAGEEALPCRLDGDDLYWQADLAAGYNYFAIKTAAVNTSVNCTASFAISAYNLTVPWAFEKEKMLSLTKIYEMANMSYASFKNSSGVNQDFKISIEKASGGLEYGRSAPSGPVNVYSKKYQKRIFETAEDANVTVAIWA